MKKAGIFLVTCFLLISIFSNTFPQTKQPEPVRRIVYEVHPNEWYQQQAKLWKQEIDKNPKNAKAWHNYYNAVRYENFLNSYSDAGKKEKLEKIVEELGQYVPNSWEYYYLKFFNSGHDVKKFSDAEKAYQIDPTRPAIFYEFICHNELIGKEDEVNKFYNKLYKSKDISPRLVNYNYNVLMSTEENSILFTNGDNDTYPARMLQEAKGIRTDVTILNVSMSTAGTYLERNLKKIGIKVKRETLFKKAVETDNNGKKSFSPYKYFEIVLEEISKQKPDIQIFFASTLYQQYYDHVKDDTYIVGLAFRYSKEKIDNIAFIKKNYEKRFRLDYLKNDWYKEKDPVNTGMAKTHNNYVPALIMLAEHYKNSGESEKISEIKDIIYNIGTETGQTSAIEHLKSRIE
jgi:hypothetical protein